MVELGERLRLAQKPLDERFVFGVLLGQQL